MLDGEALTVVGRKLGAMVGTLGNLPLTVLALAALAFLYLVLARPSRWGASALGRLYELAPDPPRRPCSARSPARSSAS